MNNKSMGIFLNSRMIIGLFTIILLNSCQNTNMRSVTVPFISDHNRMLVDAEIQGNDSSWHKVRLWVDTGNPTLILSETLARELGIDLSAADDTTFRSPNLDVQTPKSVRIGGMKINLEGVKSRVVFQPFWLFSTMHNDANLPSSVIEKYHIVFDYPQKKLTISEPGSQKSRGVQIPVSINPENGIAQVDVVLEGDTLSLALDNGASYSFISEEILSKYSAIHPEWPQITGTLGCANMWGWWPAQEETFPVVRIPEIKLGPILLKNIGFVGVPKFSQNGPALGDWYSQKTLRHVDGFLGPNAFKLFRIEMDYQRSLAYFEQEAETDPHEMDLVGISVRNLPDGNYQVVGIVQKDGKLSVEGIEPGDILLQIDDFKTQGATMGSVVDALRGNPNDLLNLKLLRDGRQFEVRARVDHFL
jgi:hypothetical protein